MPMIAIAELETHYTEEGSGDTVLVFPGQLHSSHAYTDEIRYFSDRFHVLSFDYPGTGRSTRLVTYRDEWEYDPWNYRADFACHLLLALGIEECYVMGVGGGALVALHFAGSQARLHELTVVGAIADSFLAKLDSRTLHRALDKREHYYVRQSAALRDEHGDDWRQLAEADTAFLRCMADRGGYAVPNFVLNSIRCPVLLTGSLKDPLTPGISQEYARISGIVPDCTVHLESTARHRFGEEHPLMWSDPDAFRAVSDVFLRKVRTVS